MSLRDLQPEGCKLPINEAAGVVIIPRCLGGIASLGCEVCPVDNTALVASQSPEVRKACTKRWVLVDRSSPNRVLAEADRALLLDQVLNEPGIFDVAIEGNPESEESLIIGVG